MNYRDVVKNAFVGVPKDNDGKKVQSLMYYVFDLGRLGLQNQEEISKCFKNEVSHLMRTVVENKIALRDLNLQTADDAAILFTEMVEAFKLSLSEFLSYIFEVENKRDYMIRRVDVMGLNLATKIREGILVSE